MARRRKVSEKAQDLSFRGTRIEDLCLEFTLPGYTDYDLGPRSDDDTVGIL